MIVDTHTHLYLPEFDPDNSSAVVRAIEAGVKMMIFPNVDLSTIEPMKRLHNAFTDNTRMAMGLHPTEITDHSDEALALIKEELFAWPDAYVAVGEIGMDLYWDKTFEAQQMLALHRQLEWATELGKPVIIHCREALDQTIEVMSDFPQLTGVMHSFGGTPADVDRVRRHNDMYFGINGIATFKNSKLADTICEITPQRLLLETDSPYLAPVPFRGKRNESAYIVHTAHYVSDALDMDFDSLCRATTGNASNLFALNIQEYE